MDLNDYREKKNLSYSQLGALFGWSKAKAYKHCGDRRPCMKLIDANKVMKVTDGEVDYCDLLPEGDC